MINTFLKISALYFIGSLYLSFGINKTNQLKNTTYKKEYEKNSELCLEDSTLKNNNTLFEGIELTAPVGEVIGATTFDVQTNSSISRRIANDENGRYIYAAWDMSLSFSTNFFDKGTGFNLYDTKTGAWLPVSDSKIESSFKSSSPSIGFSKDRFYCISNKTTYDHNTEGLFFSYRSIKNGIWKTSVISNKQEGWVKVAHDNGNIYCIAKPDNDFCNISGGLKFYRSLNNGDTWESMGGLEADYSKTYAKVMFEDAYQIDAIDGVISIIYGAYLSPIILYKSTDKGKTWDKKIIQTLSNPLAKNLNEGIIDFPEYTVDKYFSKVEMNENIANLLQVKEKLEDYSVKPYFACNKGNSVIIDSNGKTHVVYAAALSYKSNNENGISFDNTAALYYWNEDMTKPQIIGNTIMYDADNDGVLGNNINNYRIDYQNSFVAHPQIGIDAQDNLYVSYAAYVDGANVPNEIDYYSKRDKDDEILLHQKEFNPQYDKNIYADVFMIKTLNDGKTWEGPLNVTNAPNSEETFPSIPRNIKDTIMLIYQHDRLPGFYSYSDKDLPNINTIAAVKVLPEDINNQNAPKDSEPYLVAPNNIILPTPVGCDSKYNYYMKNFVFGLDYPDGIIKDFTIEGEVDFNTPGEYIQQLLTTDSKGNQSDTLFLYVDVLEDKSKPVILLKFLCDTFYVVKGKDYQLPKVLLFNDKKNGMPIYTKWCDISANLTINDEIDVDKMGAYKVTYTVKDYADNESSVELPVEVIAEDTVAPEIYVHYKPDTLNLAKIRISTDFEIITQDAIDCSNILVEVKGLEELKNAKKAGDYRVSVTATDQSNNQAIEEFSVVVKDLSTANNRCENATLIDVVEPGFATCEGDTINSNLKNNTLNYNSNCSNVSGYDVDAFYKFKVPKNGQVAINLLKNFMGFTILEACNGKELFCSGNTSMDKTIVKDLPKRKTVILHIFGHREGIEFCIESVNENPVKNNTCEKAEHIEVTPTITTLKIKGLNNNNNLDIEPSCIAIEPVNDQTYKIVDNFYSFKVPESGSIKISLAKDGLSSLIYAGMVISTSCKGEELYCGKIDDDGEVIKNLPTGEKLILQLYHMVSRFNLMVDIQEIGATKNNLCKNAELIEVQKPNADNYISLNTKYNTAEIKPKCYSSKADAFYKFIVPESGKIRLKADFKYAVYVHFAIYDACNGKELFCFPSGFAYSGYPEVDLPKGALVILQIFQSTEPTDENIVFTIEDAQ